MRIVIKIILILAGLFVFLILFSMAKGLSGQSLGGIFGVLLIIGGYAGVRAIWKYNPPKKDNTDKHELDKK